MARRISTDRPTSCPCSPSSPPCTRGCLCTSYSSGPRREGSGQRGGRSVATAACSEWASPGLSPSSSRTSCRGSTSLRPAHRAAPSTSTVSHKDTRKDLPATVSGGKPRVWHSRGIAKETQDGDLRRRLTGQSRLDTPCRSRRMPRHGPPQNQQSNEGFVRRPTIVNRDFQSGTRARTRFVNGTLTGQASRRRRAAA